MIKVLLTEILANTKHICVTGDTNIAIKFITNNSAEVVDGTLFVCIKGFKTDGHKFIPEAISKGAVAIITTEDVEYEHITAIKVKNSRVAMAEAACALYKNPSKELKVIGVTGTNGKTTVTHLIKSIIDMSGKTAGLIGTNNIIIGDSAIASANTTPESCALQKYFREMIENGIKYCVMEVSSHSIELNRIDGVHFEVGVFTNLTHEHLDFHETMENYLNAKSKMFKTCKRAVVNADDSYADELISKIHCKEIYTYSMNDKNADFYAENIELSDRGVKYRINDINVKAGLVGKFSVYNTLAAAACCKVIGYDEGEIEKGLIIAKGAKGRAELVPVPAPYKVIIDFAHTPDGLYNILETVKEFCRGKLITVFGAAGDRDKTKRPEMGEIAGKFSDYCIITSDNPASEQPMDIINAVEEGIKTTNCPYTLIEDRFVAIKTALDMGKDGDIVLLAGKGHETYQIIGNEKIPFCEEKIVRDYFRR